MIDNDLRELHDTLLARGNGRQHTHIQELTEAYSQPHRVYHNLQHIEELLSLCATHDRVIKDQQTLKLAVWYHDVVYDVLSKENEKLSADFAARHLSDLEFEQATIDRVTTYILASSHHVASFSEDPDLAYFLDFDLAILSTDRTKYREYTRKIRAEYGMYSDTEFAAGRAKFLETFLTRENVYSTPLYRTNFEELAQSNLRWELGTLL